MSSKKAARKNGKLTTVKELKASLSTLRAQITTSEKKLTRATNRAEQWKAEAKTQRKAASRAAARTNKLQRKLDRATAQVDVDVEGKPAARPDTSSFAPVDPAATVDRAVPDQTWSVVQLRAEARRRGLVGLSNKPKADLIAALS